MHLSYRLCAFALIFFSACALCPARAESDLCAAPPNQPGDLSLHISLDGDRKAFKAGEIIALTAEYSSPTAKKYSVNTRNYDRSGRLSDMEGFCLGPKTGSDPLSDYFNPWASFFISGGLFGYQDLDVKPYVVHLELNEWHSLPPGPYRLSLVSGRVVSEIGDLWDGPQKPYELHSNAVYFDVVEADAAWQATQLADSVAELDSAKTSKEEKTRAARILRFLGSDDAAVELARRFQGDGSEPVDWDMRFGLVGSPHRAKVIERMRAELKNPQHPITKGFANLLSTLELQSDPAFQSSLHRIAQTKWSDAVNVYTETLKRRTDAHMAEAVNVR